MARTYTLTIDGHTVEAEVWEQDGGYRVRIGENEHEVSLSAIESDRLLSLLLNGASYEIHASQVRGGYELLVRNELFRVDIQRGGQQALSEPQSETGPRLLRSPMAGIVAGIAVATGQTVERGDVIVILESMKMKNELRADESGTIERIDVHAGQQVERGQPLVEIRRRDLP